MSKPDQKGPQGHAEGDHGAKTHSRFQKQLHDAPREEALDDLLAREQSEASKGRRRLVEDREQHDEAERNSEHPKS